MEPKLPAPREAATDVLMRAMEDFGRSEGVSVIVVYTNANDDIVAVTNCKRAEAVGLLVLADEYLREGRGDRE